MGLRIDEITRARAAVAAAAIAWTVLAAPAAAQDATLGPGLDAALADLDAGDTTTVVVTFHGTEPPGAEQLTAVRELGVAAGVTFRELPMMGVQATADQVRALAEMPSVRSIWPNRRVTYYNDDATALTGVDRVRSSDTFRRLNGGMPVSGRGVGILINDSGIDAGHQDLELGQVVVQNVQAAVPLNSNLGAPVFVEDQPNTDTNSGHGTFVAGNAAGAGVQSGGEYAGVAPGADVVGVGSGAAIAILNTMAGYDYMLTHQFEYGLRVMNNSWGPLGGGRYDPDSPTAVANEIAHARGIVVLFAAGNDGPGSNTLNPHAEDPHTIGVAAGNDPGKLTGFSSRGIPGEFGPDVTAPGEAIVSVRASTGFTNADNIAVGPDRNRLDEGELPFYTVSSGTSFASPHVAGIVALMLEANPLLSVEEVRSILRETATNMPDYRPFEVGAGYVNAFAAVQKAFDTATPFGATVALFHDFETDDACAVTDVAGSPNEAAIRTALRTHALDGYADGTFRPGEPLDRAQLGRSLVFAAETRQFLPLDGSTTFSDVGSELRPFAEAVAADGAAMRDLEQDDGGVVHFASPGLYEPADSVDRAALAWSLVQALGLEDEARERGEGADGTVQALAYTETYRDTVLAGTAGEQTAEGADYVDIPFTTRASATSVTGRLTPEGGATADLDLYLRDADGNVLASSTSPDATEEVTLAVEGGEDLVYRVVGWLNAASPFRLDSEQAVTDPADADSTLATELVDFDEIPSYAVGHVLVAVERGLMEIFPAEVRRQPDGSFEAVPGPRFEPDSTVTRGAYAADYSRWHRAYFGSDARNDHAGNAAQDIVQGRFEHDADAGHIVYSLEVADLSERLPEQRWTMESAFGPAVVFVAAAVTETGQMEFEWGTIAPDPNTGVSTQTGHGAPDAAEIDGDRIEIRLATSSIEDALGRSVVGTLSTGAAANSWTMAGTSLTGGLLLNADALSAGKFAVGDVCR